MQMNIYDISEITNGQYKVRINLHELGMSSKEISTFKERYGEIRREDNEFKKICSLDNHILKYRSESIFPPSDKIDPKKKKVMIIFGNPAINSVAKGMFFYSRQDGHRHQLWGKLEKAKLLSEEIRKNVDNREIEANRIRDAIIEGSTSQDYVLGLTTFYSIPTPVKPPKKEDSAKWEYGDVDGVEILFRSVLPKLQQEEIDRLEDYDFGRGAIWICTQKSSHEYVKKIHNSSIVKYWPMRNSGGDGLRKILGEF